MLSQEIYKYLEMNASNKIFIKGFTLPLVQNAARENKVP